MSNDHDFRFIHSEKVLDLRPRPDPIGPEGAKALAQELKTNTSLNWVWLHWSGLGDDGAAAIADALKTNKTLTKVSFFHNEITDVGARAILKAVSSTGNLEPFNSTLNMICLANNNVSSELRSAIDAALKANRKLRGTGAFRSSRLYILVHVYVEYMSNPPGTSLWRHMPATKDPKTLIGQRK
jgi:Leucine Rich repeat